MTLTQQIEQDIQEWQKTEGVETMHRIGIREDSLVLDIGCGDGTFTIAEGYTCTKGAVTGLDCDQEVIDGFSEKLRQIGLQNVNAVCADILEMKADDKKGFDVITMNDLIHDISERRKFITHVKTFMRDDSILAITPFHMSETEIQDMICEVEACEMRLDHVVENGGIHFGKVKHMNGAWKRLSDFEKGNIYCFKMK